MLAFVIMRDRVTYAQRCVAALEAAGLDVVIVDHDSTWPPAVGWLDGQRDRWRRGRLIKRLVNRHPRSLWEPLDGPIAQLVAPGERFVVTDCDVVPVDHCPDDWPAVLGELLDANPAAVKAGLGLCTHDLPPWCARRDEIRTWEAQYQPGYARWAIGPQGIPAVWADIDTTLAMYRWPGPFRLGPAVRTAVTPELPEPSPYAALHLPWYEDGANLPEEIRFYLDRAEYGHWRAPDGFEDTHALGGNG